MDSNKKAVDRFLHNTGMHPDAVALESTVNHIMQEMALGLEGEPSSLAMMPTYIGVNARIPAHKRAVALDAGGTHLRAALVSFTDEGDPLIEDFSRRPMPGTGGNSVGREAFFDALAALIEPLTDRGEKIGFCFSYATEILPNRDGRLVHWSKEIQAPEVVGRLIGFGSERGPRGARYGRSPERRDSQRHRGHASRGQGFRERPRMGRVCGFSSWERAPTPATWNPARRSAS